MTLTEILNKLPKPLSFLREALSEQDGRGSSTRLIELIIVLFTCGWVTHVVVHTHSIPDLTGPSLFVGGGGGVHYLINNGSDIVSSFRNARNNPNNQAN